MKLPVFHVDAFSDRPFRGNPASVVLLERWLPDDVMQAIAAEHKLSETACVIAEPGQLRLRWFTPRVEVPICGHATLATAYVLRSIGKAPSAEMAFQTQSGALTVSRKGDIFTLNFPASPCARDDTSKQVLSTLLGTPISEVHVSQDRYLCLLQSPENVRSARPNFQAMADLPLPGVIITAQGGAPYDFTSRSFAPVKGVPEDPVTGAAHCVLAPFWAARRGRNSLAAFQASERGGQVECVVDGDRVHMSGRATVYMEGQLVIDEAALAGAGTGNARP